MCQCIRDTEQTTIHFIWQRPVPLAQGSLYDLILFSIEISCQLSLSGLIDTGQSDKKLISWTLTIALFFSFDVVVYLLKSLFFKKHGGQIFLAPSCQKNWPLISWLSWFSKQGPSFWWESALTAHAWVSGPELAPQKFLLSKKV